jgi:hypothetical protein
MVRTTVPRKAYTLSPGTGSTSNPLASSRTFCRHRVPSPKLAFLGEHSRNNGIIHAVIIEYTPECVLGFGGREWSRCLRFQVAGEVPAGRTFKVRGDWLIQDRAASIAAAVWSPMPGKT